MQDKTKDTAMVLLKSSIEESITSLGGPIEKTISWHMSRKGVFTDPKSFDIDNFSTELEGLIGPGAQMILEDAAVMFEKKSKVKVDRGLAPLPKIKRIMNILGGETLA
jgi:hypothetical protein